MGLVIHVICLVLQVCAIAISLSAQGSAGNYISPSRHLSALSPVEEGTRGPIAHGYPPRSDAPFSESHPNGSVAHLPRSTPVPAPQINKDFAPSSSQSAPTISLPNAAVSPPSTAQGIVPSLPPINKDPVSVPVAPAPRPISNWKRDDGMPVAPPPIGTPDHSSFNPSPVKAPSMHRAESPFNNAPPPGPIFEHPPHSGFHSPAPLPSTLDKHHHHHHLKNSTGPPPSHSVPPTSPVQQGQGVPPGPLYPPKNGRHTHHDAPPKYTGSSAPQSGIPIPSSEKHITPAPAPSGEIKVPFHFSPRKPKIPLPPPIQALPPPPPNEDCTLITCTEPYTNTPPGSPCGCVWPMQVELRLSVALYTFFPLVSEFAKEIAVGVFMKQSQVRIMGANAASQDPENTLVLVDLVPLGDKFDTTTAYLTYQRFWNKRLVIKSSFFGNYEVLYVNYPGLPPSPPSAPSSVSVINGQPYSGHGNNARAIHPLGVDVRGKHHKDGLSGSVIAIIILSASIVVILCCAVAWILLFKQRVLAYHPNPSSFASQSSLPKQPTGIAASTLGSGQSSLSLSFGSSIATYAGSARTFSSSNIVKATDNFNSSKIIGEGGFGLVYSGVLEDGAKVAVKVLKRDDQQGGREFFAEVEMLSRLHHRNLVKLIGICTEERSRCLVYELIPNGSVESHLHGVDKETSPLDWSARMKIALGAARGLAYLHEDSSPRVIHRDFKSSNILLEHDFTPKVSDFGLARTAFDEESRHITTRVMGTFGYVAPEYAMTGHLLVKSDVYSYGVVLLELLTGRKPVDMSQPPGEENLVTWARPLLASKEGLESMIDFSLGPNFPFDSIAKVAAIASMCVQPEVSHRPFMGEVVQALKLVCNECDGTGTTGEFGSRSCSSPEDNMSVDTEQRLSTNSPQVLPGHHQSRFSNFTSEIDDMERGLSMSDLLSSSARIGMREFGSLRRQSSSGPLRVGRSRRLWQTMRLPKGSMSEHGAVFRFWPGSH